MKKCVLISAIFLFIQFSFSQNQMVWDPQKSGTSKQLNDLHFIDDQFGWVVGNEGVILKTLDGGHSWLNISIEINEQLRGVYFLNLDTGWVIGGDPLQSAVILRTTDGGRSWENLSLVSEGEPILRDVHFKNYNKGWVTTIDRVWYTIDGGTSWVEESNGNSSHEKSCREDHIFSSQEFDLNGNMKNMDILWDKDYDRNIISEIWNSDLPDQFDIFNDFFSIYYINPNKGFGGGENGKLYKINNGWNPSVDLNYSIDKKGIGAISSIVFINEKEGWFNVSQQLKGQTNSLIYSTVNNGVNWSPNPDVIPDVLVNKMIATNSDMLFVLGVKGEIFKGYRKAILRKNFTEITEEPVILHPFRDILKISLRLKEKTQVELELFDKEGNLVRALANEEFEPGEISYQFEEVEDLINGIYFLQVRLGEESTAIYPIIKD